MQKISWFICSCIIMAACHSSKKNSQENTALSREQKDGWELLFDGKTTKGWHKYGGDPVGSSWKIADGALYLDTTKNGGDIVTDEEFENFDLRLEWKVARSSNSGIMFYVHEDKAYEYPWETGPEMQVLDNIAASDNKKENHLAGTLYDLLGTAATSKPKPVGEWNQAEIRCVNGKLDLILNGTNVASTTLWDDDWKKMIANSKFKTMPAFGTYKKGRIALQDHGHMVWFRNIMIKRL